jgi:subtilase family serine protease
MQDLFEILDVWRKRSGAGKRRKSLPIEALEPRIFMSVVHTASALRPHTKQSSLKLTVPKTWSAKPTIDSGTGNTADGSTSPYGLTPQQIRGAYGLGQYNASSITFSGAQDTGAGETICIVDAYDDPNALSDLNAFSTYFGLPTFNTSGGPTFTKYGVIEGFGTGDGLTTTLPGTDPNSPSATNSTWEQEESLDIEWAHVMAPMANIMLVEASDTGNGLYYGDYYGAAKAGVVVVSNSWGGNQFNGETGNDFIFTSPSGHKDNDGIAGGVTFVFSAGDYGAYAYNTSTITPQYPTSSADVLSVGGTTLTVGANNTYGGETAWGNGTSSGTQTGGGGGISSYETQPSWQNSVVSAFSTTKRTYPDVALDANPTSGVPIYDSWDFGASTPWLYGYEGGTSLAAPMMAGIMADVAQGRNSIGLGSMDGVTQAIPAIYKLASNNFNDITSGNNGYAAGVGYDLTTGLGSIVGNPFIVNLSGALSAVNGTSGNDTIRLVRSSNSLLVYLNNATTAFYNVPYSTLPAITVTGMTGTDSINVDFSGGATPVPSAGLTINGSSGTDTVTVTGTTSNDTATVGASTITFNGSVITYQSVSSIVIDGNGGTDLLTQSAQPGNSASLVFNGTTSGGPSSTDTLNVSAGTFTFAAPAAGAGIHPISLASLAISAGAAVVVNTAASHSDRWYLLLGALSLAGSTNNWTARLDLGGNDMIVHNGNIATLTNQVAGGFANGLWNGEGIASTAANIDTTYRTAIGTMLNSAGAFNSTTPFDGYSPSTTDVLFKYTYYGDANLDGSVNGSDYTLVDNGFHNGFTGWQNGDFNYDNTIDGSDYSLIDNLYNTQGTPL